MITTNLGAVANDLVAKTMGGDVQPLVIFLMGSYLAYRQAKIKKAIGKPNGKGDVVTMNEAQLKQNADLALTVARIAIAQEEANDETRLRLAELAEHGRRQVTATAAAVAQVSDVAEQVSKLSEVLDKHVTQNHAR